SEYVVVAACNHSARWSPCRGTGFGCRLDEVGHFGWVGDHGDMAGRDFDRGRAHAAGEQALAVWRYGLVLRGDEIPARQRLPGRHAHHVVESGTGKWLSRATSSASEVSGNCGAVTW